MDFCAALHVVKNGGRVTREAWLDGIFVFLVTGSRFEVNRPPLLGIFPEGTPIAYHPHIDIHLPDGSIAVWTPGQTDLLSHDWKQVVVKPPHIENP